MPTQHRYVFLDGLRGLAALSICFGHAAYSARIGYFFPNGAMAVDFFFCLSGFVLASAYDDKLAAGLGFRSFMTKRLIRLYPMIFLGVILGTAVQAFLRPDAAATIAGDGLAGLFLFPSGLLRGADLYPANGPMWSLFFELSACVAYALAVRRLPRLAWPILAAASGAVLAAYVWRMGDVTHIGIEGRGSFLAGFARCAYPFLLGVLIFRAKRLREIPANGLLLAGLLMLALLNTIPKSATYQMAAVLVALPAIVALGANVQARKLAPAWDTLGRLSYPLYLVHYPLLLLMRPQLDGLALWPRAALETAVSAAVAWVVLLAYDEPLRRWLADRSRAARPQVQAA